MNTEKLIAKGVEKHFNGQQVLFKVSSLNEHFEGLQIHDSDIITLLIPNIGAEKDYDEVEFVKVGDVNFDNATANEVAPKVEEEETPLFSGMTYEEAEGFVLTGELIALPEWGGFWFVDLNDESRKIMVLTKEGEITDTPFEEFKERNDWVIVEATEEQQEILQNYFATNESPVEEIEVIDEEVVETIPTEKFEEPIVEIPAPKVAKTKKKK